MFHHDPFVLATIDEPLPVLDDEFDEGNVDLLWEPELYPLLHSAMPEIESDFLTF